jgi:cytochrome c
MVDARQLTVVFVGMLASSAAFASAELARSKNCVACHSVERKMIGPSYQAIAAKYADDDSAVRTLSERVLKGGVGVWGQMPMPPQPGVSQDEAEALAKWVLSQK